MPSPSMEFRGEEEFAASAERVFGVLTQPDQIQRGIPDLVKSQQVSETELECTVRPGFSFLRGTLKLRIIVAEKLPVESALLAVTAQGIGVGLKVESRFQLRPTEAGCALTWEAQVMELKGLVASISPGLVRAAAEQVVRQGWSRIRDQVESQPD